MKLKISFNPPYVAIPLEYTGYGHYIYMLTDITNNKRYIDSYTGYPYKEEIYDSITERPIYEAILKKGLGSFKLDILSKHKDDVYIHLYKDIELRRYAVLGLYNKSYYDRDITNKSVICIETGKDFETSVQAGSFYGIDPSSIRKALNGKRKTAGGYSWKYYKDYLNEGV